MLPTKVVIIVGIVIKTILSILRASNGEIVGRSENYVSSAGRENGIAAVKHNAPDARVVDLT